MTNCKFFGTDGIRGKVGDFPITPDFALKLGWAAGKVLAKNGKGKVILGKDTRISGYMLESALEAGLAAAGVEAAFTGPMPTPAIAYLTQTFRADAGIVISASHNPYYDNGIKFFSNEGKKLSDEIELMIETVLTQQIDCVSSEKLGKASRINDAAGRYIEFCKSTFDHRINLVGLKIVVDCANGATYHIAPKVLKELGATVIKMGCEPDGVNINQNCGATDVKALSKRVLSEQADVGFALDGDGDRIIMVDHQGNKIDGDQIIYILVKEAYRTKQLQGGVVGTLMSNMGLELALEKLAIPFIRANVGDRYVMEQMLVRGYKYGAENSGHILLLDKTSSGDGIIAGLQVLAAMVNNKKSLAELNSEMELLPQVLINVHIQKDSEVLSNENVVKIINDVKSKLAGNGRLLIRKSGTEPLIRIMIEGKNKDQLIDLAQSIEKVMISNQ